MNNGVYGKTIENFRIRIGVRLISNINNYSKSKPKPSYVSQKIFDKVAIRKSKVTLKFNKSAYFGMCILDLSKVFMYEFHYDYIKNNYAIKSRLLFIDTVSLMYETKTEDAYVYVYFSKEK